MPPLDGTDRASGNTAAQPSTNEAEENPPDSGGAAQKDEFQFRDGSRYVCVPLVTDCPELSRDVQGPYRVGSTEEPTRDGNVEHPRTRTR